MQVVVGAMVVAVRMGAALRSGEVVVLGRVGVLINRSSPSYRVQLSGWVGQVIHVSAQLL